MRKSLPALLAIGILVAWSVAGFWISTPRDSNKDTVAPPVHSILQRNMVSTASWYEAYPARRAFESIFDDVFGSECDVDSSMVDKGSSSLLSRIAAPPSFVAIVGQPYVYDTGLEWDDACIVSAPDGVSIEGGVLRWTPLSKDMDYASQEKNFKVGYFRGDSAGVVQEYRVKVTSESFLLGTDLRGRPISNLIIRAGRWIILPGLVAVLGILLFGLIPGVLAGYRGGRPDAIVSSFAQVSESVPIIIVLVVVAIVTGMNIYATMFVVGMILAPGAARDIKARVRSLNENQFIESARELGLSEKRVIWSEVVWYNCMDVITKHVFAVLLFSVVVEITLSYLKVGLPESEISLGGLILAGRALAFNQGAYWLLALSCGATIAAMGLFAMAGNAVTEFFKRGE
ncbi:MAG: ABC transporter permease subunit [Rhodothermales bacterium]